MVNAVLPALSENVGGESSALQLLAAVLDHEPVGVTILRPVDGDFVYAYVNAAFQALNPLQPMLGRRLREVWPEQPARAIPALNRVLETGETAREADLAVDITVGGASATHYFTYEISRTQVDGTAYLIGVAADVTTEVESRRASEEAGELAKKELDLTRLLLNSAGLLAEWTAPELMLDALAKLIVGATDHGRVAISLWDADRRELRVVAAAGEPAVEQRVYTWDEISTPTRQVIDSRQKRLANYAEIPEEERGTAYAQGGRLALVVPMLRGDRVVGIILVDQPKEQRGFSEREVQVVEGIAAQSALAIENARLLAVERERARFGSSMTEINADLASSLSIEETLPAVLVRVRQEVQAHIVAIADRVPTGWRIRSLVGDAGPVFVPGFIFTDDAAPTLMRLMRERLPDVVPDVATAEHANRMMAAAAGYRGYVAQPLIVHGEVAGALGIFFAEPRNPSGVELDYFRRVAFAVSLAEENSRLYQSEHRIAETLQGALLALPNRIPGIEFADLYRSATDAARVGGDFYDLFEVQRDMIGITVGDISGHGIDAAVLTSLVKNSIRVQAAQGNRKPDEVMATSSRLLYENSPAEIFATAFFGVLHLDDNLLEYCNAGHTTGAAVCSSGGVSKLEVNSPLIGAFADAVFTTSTTRLAEDDMLFLYTDGLTEARRHDGEFYGEERLFELLARARERDSASMVRAVTDEVLAFAEGQLSDDLAILAVERRRR